MTGIGGMGGWCVVGEIAEESELEQQNKCGTCGTARAGSSCFSITSAVQVPLLLFSMGDLSSAGITPYLIFLVFVTTLGPLQFGYHLVWPDDRT